jgi:hypothetical protein
LRLQLKPASMMPRLQRYALFCLLAVSALGRADVLPPDEADMMYKRYEGGGIKAQGPSYLVRKSIGDSVSVHAEYYIDQVTGASIDSVVSGASPIREDRKQKTLGVEYLRDKTTYSATVINGIENDYDSSTANIAISQSMFGDLTTVTLSASRGWDIIEKRVQLPTGRNVDDPAFGRRHLYRRNWSLGISQIVTRNLLVGLAYEANTEQGYTQNPYRSIRYVDPSNPRQFDEAPEIYPSTRTGNALGIKAKYYLSWNASANAGFRYYDDTWAIHAKTFDLGYVQPFLHDALTADVTVRYYTQTQASFYSDLFPRANFQNFMARDRELAALYNVAYGGGLSYEFLRSPWHFVKKSTVSFHIDRIMYQYKNFRNAEIELLQKLIPGTGPLYSTTAWSEQVFFSFFY